MNMLTHPSGGAADYRLLTCIHACLLPSSRPESSAKAADWGCDRLQTADSQTESMALLGGSFRFAEPPTSVRDIDDASASVFFW